MEFYKRSLTLTVVSFFTLTRSNCHTMQGGFQIVLVLLAVVSVASSHHHGDMQEDWMDAQLKSTSPSQSSVRALDR